MTRAPGRSAEGRWHGRTWARLGLVPLAFVMLTGCAGLGLRPVDTAVLAAPPARLDDVPFVAGDDGHCGPAALATVLAWSGRPAAVGDLAPRLLTPARGGTLEHDLAAVARAEGRLAVPLEGFEAVVEEVAAGHPVIVLQNLGLSWYPQWHYAVVVGHDLPVGVVEVHSGPDAYRRIALETFRQTFQRAGGRGLVVLPPDRLPASAGRDVILQAAAGLERAARPEAAHAAYRAVLERWPDAPSAWFGVGNALLALGDLEAASDAFQNAARDQRLAASALNNLAHVLMLRGDLEGAEAAARGALARGGSGTVAAQATLEEVRRARGTS